MRTDDRTASWVHFRSGARRGPEEWEKKKGKDAERAVLGKKIELRKKWVYLRTLSRRRPKRQKSLKESPLIPRKEETR